MQVNKLCVYRSVKFSANNLREDYKFHHTFSTEIAKFLKVSSGKLVVMQPEKFQSKYEPRSNVLDIQVSEGPRGHSSPQAAFVGILVVWFGFLVF